MKTDNIHKNHRERMRKRFDEVGFSGWSDYEILEYMLYNVYRQGDTNPTAHKLLDYSAGNIVDLMRNARDFRMVNDVENVGEKTVLFLRSLEEFCKYYRRQEFKHRPIKLGSVPLVDIFNTVGFEQDRETILMVCLDKFLNIKSISDITQTSSDMYASTTLDRIMKVATVNNAHAIMVAHNHPDGESNISINDKLVTDQLDTLMDRIGIVLLDHYVYCNGVLYSVKAHMFYDELEDGISFTDKVTLGL